MDKDKYLKECLEIDNLALEEEFTRMPADLAYWANQYAEATKAFHLAKIDLDRTEAKLAVHHRVRLADAGVKATESMVTAAVETDDTLYNAKVRLLEAEYLRNQLSGTCEAVRSKRDMLISLGANYRAEMQGDPSIRSIAKNMRAGNSER
jgi:hypothetical protein